MNGTVSAATKVSPFYLNYGREPSLPIDVAMADLRDCTVESTSGYLQRVKSALDSAK